MASRYEQRREQRLQDPEFRAGYDEMDRTIRAQEFAEYLVEHAEEHAALLLALQACFQSDTRLIDLLRNLAQS